MKLLGRTKAIKVYDFLVQLDKLIKNHEVHITKKTLSEETGVSDKSLDPILNYLEIAGYIKLQNSFAQGTTSIKIMNIKYKPKQSEIDLAAVAYTVYKNNYKEKLFVQSGKNGSLMPNILFSIIGIYYYVIYYIYMNFLTKNKPVINNETIKYDLVLYDVSFFKNKLSEYFENLNNTKYFEFKDLNGNVLFLDESTLHFEPISFSNDKRMLTFKRETSPESNNFPSLNDNSLGDYPFEEETYTCNTKTLSYETLVNTQTLVDKQSFVSYETYNSALRINLPNKNNGHFPSGVPSAFSVMVANETYDVQMKEKGVVIRYHDKRNNKMYTYECSYYSLRYITEFINEYIDLDKLYNAIQSVEHAKQLTKMELPAEYDRLVDVKKTESIRYCPAVKIGSPKTPESYSKLYSLLTQKAMLLNHLFTLEEKREIAIDLYKEMMKEIFNKDMSDKESLKTIVNPETIKEIDQIIHTFANLQTPRQDKPYIKAAIAALVYGYVPYAVGTAQTVLYLRGLKHFIKDQNAYRRLYTRLFNLDTRFEAYDRIFYYVVRLWEHISKGQSSVARRILKQVENNWKKSYTKSELRFVNAYEKLLDKYPGYKMSLNAFAVDPKQFKLKKVVKKNELLAITKDNIIYHYTLYSLLDNRVNPFSFGISLLPMLKKLYEYFQNRPEIIKLTLSDLATFSIKENLKKMYKITNVITSKIKKYHSGLSIAYTELADELFDYLISRDEKYKDKRGTIKKVIQKIFEISGSVETIDPIFETKHKIGARIWENTLMEYVDKVIAADADFFIGVIDMFKDDYSPTYLKWHGYKIVNSIIAYMYGETEELDLPKEHRIYEFEIKEVLPWQNNLSQQA
ncbi:hypothetical protein SU69_02055 [Thermosipho melanesiensis]|uniref:Uncharacterized protein n=2 Tax=Thermosipho melanesiensis TaxID=46541 RepID=A6LK11_THEM4|nr:hypothetical protein [Thermosipho melanesiensis]ABR30262.1 hypothetical protein Tmel_0393 [Thermosipho melanesiensis BI429]APT74811.1 hypothetical protein BW47_02145 [Thermosipho melanesiensis]OOC37392.1 hypothetical protein SU68_02065 [Thermosipho melanesiensis]OOC39754.1 hypothetical protein SU69_02055 [Thermosipho melanesiensis]OOC39859.1 hypothetical protein SU70_02050 [Thermosipho melanesiensis]